MHMYEASNLDRRKVNNRARDREWFLGQTVMARKLQPGLGWVKNVIVEHLAPLSYLIETENHQFWKHHTDQRKVIDVSPRQVQPLLESTEFQEEPNLELC